MPVTDLPPPSAVLSSSGIGTSTVREANGSPMANNSPPLDGFIVEDCSDDAELEEEQIDFTFSEEEDEGSSPSSLAPVTLELPASLKGANFNPSNTVKAVPVWLKFSNLPLKCWTPRCLSKLASVLGKPIQCDKLTSTKERLSYARVLMEVDLLADLRSSINVTLPNGNPFIQKVIYETLPKFCKHCKVIAHSTEACFKGKEEATTIKKASSASVATKKNVKGSVFTRLSPIVDTLVDALPAAALPVKVSPVNAPLVDAPKLNAPIVPSETCNVSTGACSKGKEEATTVKKASSASVATKKNVKGSVFTRLSPIVDTLVDALPAAALPVKVSPVNAPLVDALKLNAPIVPSETCVAQDEQLCS
ncbi:hypothetical protein NC653_000146 [Populus alba x Populus x berolinensis]|uniref:DUF4283 domain-containing protein n=1 Tax=Populus alba x Populus x berolinensis TaxID=444605 RepID=A0AAD6WEI4_9ROSI|nr:hypothetical protein NC653_000146 [Populus alba x Populus x berolinensis]